VEITENCEEFAASQKTNFLYFKKTLPKPIKKLEKNPEIGNLPLCQFKAFDENRIIGLFNYDCVFEIIMVDKHKTYPS